MFLITRWGNSSAHTILLQNASLRIPPLVYTDPGITRNL